MMADVDRLEYCSERFLFLRVATDMVSGHDWTYFSADEFPFNRVSEATYDRFEMVPPGRCSLTFEFPCNDSDEEWTLPDDALLDRVPAL